MNIVHEKNGTPLDTAILADYIASGKIIGVVRDRCEHGPRALGNRSILCNPSIRDMKDTLNAKVKGREYYRPFAPVVRLEDVSKYFEWEGETRWMSFCPKVREEYRDRLAAITHIDGTARVQTVTKEQNKFLYELLTELHNKTGIGVLLNTSFNIAGKPILNTYKEALWVLENKELDAVVLETFIIHKEK
jgi:carbamoyltransferase